MEQARKWWRPATGVALAATVVWLSLSTDVLYERATLVYLKTTGQLEGIRWSETLEMLNPASPFPIEPLLKTRNAYVAITNPHTSESDRESGARSFQVWCASCHGGDGTGASAPSLVGRTLKAGDSDWWLFRTVREGQIALGMPAVPVTAEEAWQIVGHIRALRNGAVFGKEYRSASLHHVNLTADRIEAAAAEPHNWLTYSGTYASRRHSTLADIDVENVADLKLAWSLQLGTNEEYVETSPIVVDGVMYLSAPASDVLAVDAATGEVVWRYRRSVPTGLSLCCGTVNRGVAVLGDRVFIGTIEGYLVALDASTGEVAWEVQVADWRQGYSITAAPLAVRDKVVVGIGGGEFGIRGFLDAYDAATGARAWRFYTIPEPGQPGSETWRGDSWKTGGGATWVTGSYDPELGLLYWGVGNPAPDFNGDVRPGDNLYSDSVIALDVETGDLKWHFQFTPHDEHDWDSNQVPVLVDHDFGGEPRRLMLWANRNGFYYVLDRVTGEFLHATAFVKQNWAEGIDAKGRPMVIPTAAPSKLGTLTWPGLSGGGNWWSPSFSPETDLIYVPFAEGPKVFFKSTMDLEYVAGREFMGSASVHTGEPIGAGIRALNPITGELVWEYLRQRPQRNVGRIGGALSTAGNVVFAGDLLDFVAFDARDGRELWRVNLGGQINAAPISFAIAGTQRVAIPAGNTLYVFRP
jgi:alcohol dehydrogenase (cytochrome c)